MKKAIIGGGLFIMSAFFILNSCSSAPEKPQTYTVEIKEMKFVPEDIAVKKGDTILFMNHDIVAHDVTEEASKAWTSGRLEAGKSWKLAVSAEAHYYCSIHAVMKGKIELE